MNHLAAAENAFLALPTQIGEYTLRPLSATSFLVLSRTNNPLLTASVAADAPGGPTADFDLTDPATLSGFFAFIYIHAAPIGEVLRASRQSPEEWQDAVEIFASTLPLDAILPAREEVAREIGTTVAAAFEAEPPPSDTPPTPDDPNA